MKRVNKNLNRALMLLLFAAVGINMSWLQFNESGTSSLTSTTVGPSSHIIPAQSPFGADPNMLVKNAEFLLIDTLKNYATTVLDDPEKTEVKTNIIVEQMKAQRVRNEDLFAKDKDYEDFEGFRLTFQAQDTEGKICTDCGNLTQYLRTSGDQLCIYSSIATLEITKKNCVQGGLDNATLAKAISTMGPIINNYIVGLQKAEIDKKEEAEKLAKAKEKKEKQDKEDEKAVAKVAACKSKSWERNDKGKIVFERWGKDEDDQREKLSCQTERLADLDEDSSEFRSLARELNRTAWELLYSNNVEEGQELVETLTSYSGNQWVSEYTNESLMNIRNTIAELAHRRQNGSISEITYENALRSIQTRVESDNTLQSDARRFLSQKVRDAESSPRSYISSLENTGFNGGKSRSNVRLTRPEDGSDRSDYVQFLIDTAESRPTVRGGSLFNGGRGNLEQYQAGGVPIGDRRLTDYTKDRFNPGYERDSRNIRRNSRNDRNSRLSYGSPGRS